MKILGIGEGFHDNGIALIDDGEVIIAINEERLSRRKFDVDVEHCLAYCFGRKGIDPDSIDVIAIAGVHQSEYIKRLEMDVENWLYVGGENIKLETYALRFARKVWLKKVSALLAKYNLSHKPLVHVDHHMAHAAGAYVGSGKEPVIVFTADGWGDGYSGGCFKCENGSIVPLHKIGISGSAGVFYAAVTSLLGFNAMRHGGKITGLAAYGKKSGAMDIIENSFRFEGDTLVLSPKYYLPHGKAKNRFALAIQAAVGILFNGSQGYLKAIRKQILNSSSDYFTKHLRQDLSTFSREDIAHAFQESLQNIMCKYISHHLANNGSSHMALSGGVFANVRLNQKIAELDKIKSVYVFPNMGDGGLALGAAYIVWLEQIKNKKTRFLPFPSLDNVYLGWEATENEIIQTLNKYSKKVKWRYCKNVETVIAKHIAEKKVIGRYGGAMEYGPRALGNRSILYHAGDISVNNWLNKRLKRTEFMPFAPTTLWEYRKDYYTMDDKDWETAEFMTITFECTELMIEKCPAAVHIDNTARPQLIRKDVNRSFYKIIDEYHKLTGIATIVNTSFNMHEEPIVCTPNDAIRAFLSGACDILFLEHFEVEKI